MFSIGEDRLRFLPGEKWIYFKLYMGPQSSEEWIVKELPKLIANLDKELHCSTLFFIRYLDPDFHVRLRIKLEDPNNFPVVISLVNKTISELRRAGLFWKSEICTYEREIERYSAERIEIFETAFSIDSMFWMRILNSKGQDEDFEDYRWKIALASMYHLYTDLMGEPSNWMPIVSKCISFLSSEIMPSKTFLYQTDMKFRKNRVDIEDFISGHRLKDLGIYSFFNQRSKDLKSLFSKLIVKDSFFETPKGKQNITDLVHMSLNRGLRSKHRVQELVLYRYLLKIAKAQMVKRS